MTPAIPCPACGGATTPGARFCPTCGAPVIAEERRSPTRDPLYGHVQRALVHEFDITREIGRGGMAAVYLAHDLHLGRKVALKVMLPELAYAELMPERFLGEARTAAILDHPNIVSIFRAGETDGVRFFAMRYIDGCSLEQLVRALGQVPIGLACYVLAHVARALDFAHAEGVIHRDVKPGNVMLDRRWGRAIVTDFGIARVLNTEHLTRSGFAIGTPIYMSPEQCMGEEPASSADQYALGVVAYQLLTGETPFTGTPFEVQMAHLREPPRPIRALRPDCPPDLEATVLRMLAKEPGDRWPSLAEAAPLLQRHAEGTDAEQQAELRRMIVGMVPPDPSLVATPSSALPTQRARIAVPPDRTGPTLAAPVAHAEAASDDDTAASLLEAITVAGSAAPAERAQGVPSELPARTARAGALRGGWGRVAALVALAVVATGAAVALRFDTPDPGAPPAVEIATIAPAPPPPVAVPAMPVSDSALRLDSVGGVVARDSVAPAAPVRVALAIWLPAIARRGGVLAVDESLPLHVILDSSGRRARLEGPAVSWRSSDASVLSITGGTVRARRVGEAFVSASVGGATGRRKLTVVGRGDTALLATSAGAGIELPGDGDVQAAVAEFVQRLEARREAAIPLPPGSSGEAAAMHGGLAGWLGRGGRLRVQRVGAPTVQSDGFAPAVHFAVAITRARRLQTDQTVTAAFRATLARDPNGAWRVQEPVLTRPFAPK